MRAIQVNGPKSKRALRRAGVLKADSPAVSSSATRISRPKLGERLALHEFPGLVQMVADLHVGIDAERVIDRRQQVVRMHRFFLWRRGGRIGLSVLNRAADSGAGDHRTIAVRPVVAAVRRVGVSGCGNAEPRTASEFADGHYDGLLQ